MELLSAYPWPGNVRELRNVIERMVVLGSSEKLTVRDLPSSFRLTAGRGESAVRPGSALRDAERQLIEDSLRKNKGSRTRAAQDLGISRRTLHRKLNEFGLRNSEDE